MIAVYLWRAIAGRTPIHKTHQLIFTSICSTCSLQKKHHYPSGTADSLSSIFRILYFHRYHPMAESPHNRRIQPKSLNIDITSATPPENQFLSPTLSVLSLSPPPRLQADDYFSSKRAKKRRQSRLKRPCPTPLLLSEDTGSGETSLSHDARPGTSKHNNVDPSYDHSDDGGLLNETIRLDPPRATIAAGGQDGTGLWAEQSVQRSTVSHHPTFVHGNPGRQDDSFDLDDSPAVNSLRRISQSMTQSSNSKRREFKHLSKILTDKINTTFRSKGKSPFEEFGENADRSNIFGFQKASTDPSTFRKSVSGDLSPTSRVSNAQAARLRSPAYITLRKASGANSLGGTANANNPPSSGNNIIDHNQQSTNSTSSNLLSFQSQLEHQAAAIAWQKDPKLVKRSTSPVSSFSCDEKPHVRERFMSLSQLGNFAHGQQYATPAEPALTVTSFYPTRAASSNPQSRSSSVSLERAPFRFSIVQIVSRKSIHEVIWYEDETPTSDTFSSPISPRNDSRAGGGSVPKVVVDSGGHETPLISITTSPTGISAPLQVNEHASTDSLIDPTDAHKRLLSWSWDNPRPSIADFSSSSQEGNEAPEVRERTSNVSMRSKFSMRRAATADILAAGYSPHVTEQDSMPGERDTNEESMPKPGTEKKKEGDTPENFDRGMDMFQRRGISLGSVPGARIGSQSVGEKNGVQNAGSQLRVSTK